MPSCGLTDLADCSEKNLATPASSSRESYNHALIDLISSAFPLHVPWVINRIWGKGFILSNEIDYRLQKHVKLLAVSTAFFPMVVSIDSTGVLNRPHSAL